MSFAEKIRSKTATIGIVSIGYVGIPSAQSISQSSFNFFEFHASGERMD